MASFNCLALSFLFNFAALGTVSSVKNYEGSSGSVSSELVNGRYRNEVNEVHEIRVTNGSRVKLSFDKFDVLGSMPGCSGDSLTVTIGCTEKRTIGKFCSCGLRSLKRFDIFSMDECISLTFMTDSKDVATGFNVTYTAFPQKQSISTNPNCSNLVLQDVGNFFSPLWPNFYSVDLKCTWTLKIPENFNATITFMNFEIESDFTCNQKSNADDLVAIKASTSANPSDADLDIIEQRMCSKYSRVTTKKVELDGYRTVFVKFNTDSDQNNKTGLAVGFLSFQSGVTIFNNTCGESPAPPQATPQATTTPNGTSTNTKPTMTILIILTLVLAAFC